jgi:hypothetical protein
VVEPAPGLVLASESLVAHDMVSLAWLIECRREVPEKRQTVRRDPYTSQFIVNMGNRWVVKLLGGMGKALGSERLVRNDLETIWDDRVLRRAFQISGGVPRLSLTEANKAVSGDLKRRLAAMTTAPRAARES